MAKSENLKEFDKWFNEWFFGNDKQEVINIFISAINEIDNIYDENALILYDISKRDNNEISAKPYLKDIFNKVDELGLNIYLFPLPSPLLNNIKSQKYKDRITKEYLISYFSKYGFILLENGYMKRIPIKK